MGDYLSTPIKTKDIIEGENAHVFIINSLPKQLRFAGCGMQGWRKNMEDAHLCEINIGNDIALFGVFDGHGGIILFAIDNF